MRVKKFYPKQVSKRLQGKNPQSLTAGEHAALQFFIRKGRKMGVALAIAQTSLAGFRSSDPQEMAAILGNCNMTIRVGA